MPISSRFVGSFSESGCTCDWLGAPYNRARVRRFGLVGRDTRRGGDLGRSVDGPASGDCLVASSSVDVETTGTISGVDDSEGGTRALVDATGSAAMMFSWIDGLVRRKLRFL